MVESHSGDIGILRGQRTVKAKLGIIGDGSMIYTGTIDQIDTIGHADH